MPNLSPEIIEAAIEGLEAKKVRIDSQIAELRGMLGGATSVAPAAKAGAKKKFSAAALQRMREAQQRRWAKVRGESAPAAKTVPIKKTRRKMSAAGRRAIAEAQRKRWAAKKAGKA